MAVSTLVRLSEDKITRLKYLRWQDDAMLRNRKEKEYALMKQRVEQEKTERNRQKPKMKYSAKDLQNWKINKNFQSPVKQPP